MSKKEKIILFWKTPIKRNSAILLVLILIGAVCAGIYATIPIALAIVFGSYLIATFVLFNWKTELYYKFLLSFRKALYLLFFVSIIVLVTTNIVGIKDWAILLALTGIAIFIDLTLFQTPDITKIWNAEFKHGEFHLKNLYENKRILNRNTQKVLKHHEVLIFTDTFFDEAITDDTEIDSWFQYKDIVHKYLSHYTDPLDLVMKLTHLQKEKDADKRTANIKASLNEALIVHDLSLEEDSEVYSKLITGIGKGAQSEIRNEVNENIVIFAYMGNSYDFIITLKSKDNEDEANKLDATHLINLCYIFDWWDIN